MKSVITSTFILAIVFNSFSQIGIGTTSPNHSSILEVNSNEKGLLIPRLSTNQRNVITNPANGLMIYNSTINCIEVNYGNSSDPIWRCSNESQNNDVKVIQDLSGFDGVFVEGSSISNGYFKVFLVNNKFNDVGLTLNSTDLNLTGIEGINIGIVDPENAWLPVGDTVEISYQLLGTPNEIGILSGDWQVKAMSCIKSVIIGNGSANFLPQNTYYTASFIDTNLNVSYEGVLDNEDNQFKMKIPYTNGEGSYDGFTSDFIRNFEGSGVNGEINRFRILYPAGTFSSSGYIDAVLEVDGDESFSIEKLFVGEEKEIIKLDLKVNGNIKGNILIKSTGGIPDRNFSDDDHKFIYTTVMALDGNVWLSHNLGANYTNINNPSFNLSNSVLSYNDLDAYGSLYQWGRFSDGHELINYTTSGVGISNYGDTNLIASNHLITDSLFIKASGGWTSSGSTLWQSSGVNNPCPVGFRIPTSTEFNTLLSLEGITNINMGSNSILGITAGGYRNRSTGEIISENFGGYFWTSTTNGSGSNYLKLSSNRRVSKAARAMGYSCRCINE